MASHERSYTLQVVSVEQRGQWDDFVAQHPDGHLLQSWAWGDVKATAGWSPLRLALRAEHTSQFVAGAQVLRRGVPHVPLRLGHLAYIPKGPLLDWSQTALCETFFSHIDQYLRRQGALALRIEPGLKSGTSCAELSKKRLEQLAVRAVPPIQPARTILLDLASDEQELLAHMKEKWRYNVRLATKKGVTVRVAEQDEDVRAWYKLLQVTSERDQFGIHTVDYFLHIWHILALQGLARLFLAEYDGQLLAGIFVTLFARQAIYLYGASSNEQRKLMPNYLLQWEAIRWAKQQGAEQYDFWGIPETDDEHEAMAGVYRFKRGWGGRVVRFLGAYERVYRPVTMRIARHFV